MTRLSVVAPVFNEAAILEELARRCAAAARAVTPDAEVLLVDDCSTDATPSLRPDAEVLRLPHNRGQFGATQAGLAAARGAQVVVIDGDLQDPPELIPELVAALTPDLDVVFAVKRSRDDPWWFHVGRAAYAALLALPGARAVPAGAGAYCVMRADVARRVAGLSLPDANLAPALVALGVRYGTVSYAKGPRYDGRSRVGPVGLVREALPSLALTGAATALLTWTAVAVGLGSLLLPIPFPARMAGGLIAAALAAAGFEVRRRARAVLARASQPHEPGRGPTGGGG